MADGSVVIDVIANEKEAQNLLQTLQSIEKQTILINGKMNRSSSVRPFKEPTKDANNMLKAILGSKGIVFAMNLVKDSVGDRKSVV